MTRIERIRALADDFEEEDRRAVVSLPKQEITYGEALQRLRAVCEKSYSRVSIQRPEIEQDEEGKIFLGPWKVWDASDFYRGKTLLEAVRACEDKHRGPAPVAIEAVEAQDAAHTEPTD